MRPLKNYARVWRREGTRFESGNVLPTFKSGFASLSVWGMFSARGRSPLVRISGTLNQEKYINILKIYVLPFKSVYHNGDNEFLYQHDGCRPHRAKTVSESLEAKGVDVLPWTSKSLDLNPIENVWPIMKRRLRKPDNYNQLCCIWNGLPYDYLSTLADSMVSRCSKLKMLEVHQQNIE